MAKKEDLTQELEEMELEDIFRALNELMDKLEDRHISLDTSFALYTQGVQMLKACNEKLDRVEKKMLTIDENGELDEF